MKAYIAGKITGDPNYREKFQKGVQALQEEGFIVINPARLPDGMQPGDYMKICFAMIDVADVVAFLPDWNKSPGARLEFEYCDYTSKQIMFLSSMTAYKKIISVAAKEA